MLWALREVVSLSHYYFHDTLSIIFHKCDFFFLLFLCSPGNPFVDQVSLEPRDLPVCASLVLGLKGVTLAPPNSPGAGPEPRQQLDCGNSYGSADLAKSLQYGNS
ncbi:hypothetical protein H671_3g9637 [Cricetulus griseus]|uniref:Uncharacterized protein n=1 Tax=Cricetulus griseus TaxID=10029 RepID=A0A061IFA2_CRIGR|nr:hypothetical protein H671_3g9637 [Cricetulus griseus]